MKSIKIIQGGYQSSGINGETDQHFKSQFSITFHWKLVDGKIFQLTFIKNLSTEKSSKNTLFLINLCFEKIKV